MGLITFAFLTFAGVIGAQKDPRGVTWIQAYTKADASLAQLSNEEKVGIVTGTGWQVGNCVGNTKAVKKIGLPSLCLQDGPVGVRYQKGVSVFPAGIHAAATWDNELMYKRGEALGAEARAHGVHIQLGPVAGPLGKIPNGGRNWEGFSPDPYLTGIAMYDTITGMQSAGVQANAKHYIGNEQELDRTKIDSRIDDRTMHELYLWPFADSVHANVASFMCSYNKLNGTYACENDKAINGLLKDELEFKGFIMTDWMANHTLAGGAKAGLDMSMPGTDFNKKNTIWGPALLNAVPSRVSQARLDDMVRRILASWYYLGQDKDYPADVVNSWNGGTGGPSVFSTHQDIARAVARDGIILLKNEGQVLPLKKPRSLAVIGTDAIANPVSPNQCVDRACNNSTLAMGWGSGTAEYPYLSAPLDAIKARATRDGGSTTIHTSQTDDPTAGAAAAQKADTVLVFINAHSGEEYLKVENHATDRSDLDPWHNGNGLVAAVAGTGKPTIVVVHSVGPIILEKILALQNVRAVVWAGLPGQESGNALVDVLYGDVSPSGKLPFTIAKAERDYGAAVQPGQVDGFKEGVYVDYRGFDRRNVEPRFEFGFGLSYSNFSYSDLQIKHTNTLPSERFSSQESNTSSPQTQASLYAPYGPTITTRITNTGTVPAAEAAQLYLGFQESGSPPWQLRGFKKVLLKPGESKTVEFRLRKKDVSYWDVRTQRWEVVRGGIAVRVAKSSREQGVGGTFTAV